MIHLYIYNSLSTKNHTIDPQRSWCIHFKVWYNRQTDIGNDLRTPLASGVKWQMYIIRYVQTISISIAKTKVQKGSRHRSENKHL